MSFKIGPAEALWAQVTKMQKEAVEEAAKKGIKKFAVAGGAFPPNGPGNKNNLEIIKKVAKNIDLSSNSYILNAFRNCIKVHTYFLKE